MKTVRIAMAAAGLIAATSVASADTYTIVNFSGGLFGGSSNVRAPFSSILSPGETFTGSFVYDDALVPASGSGFVNVFPSAFPDTVPGITFSIGSYTYTVTDPNAAIQYNNGRFNGFNINQAFSFNGADYVFSDQGGLFSVYETVGGAPTFNQLVGGYINIGDANLTGAAPYTPVTVTPGVPEPSTWAMMLLGFAGLGLFARRKAMGARTAA